MTDLAHSRRIAVIRALPGLGDMLCAVPALRSLRAAAPHAEITVLGLPQAAWFPDRFARYVDSWLELPHWPSIPEATGPRHRTLELIAEYGGTFDTAVQLQGSGGPINALACLLASGTVAVHAESADHAFSGGSVRVVSRPWPSTGHESDRLLGLVRLLGAPDTHHDLEFPAQESDDQELARHESPPGDLFGDGWAVVHPGASRDDRRWSVTGFVDVARRLGEKGTPVVVTGVGNEATLVRDVCAAASAVPVVDAPLGAMAALLRRARVLVSNDTGVAHLGVAVGTPTVVVGTTSDLDRWGPRNRSLHAAIRATGRTPLDVQRVIEETERVSRRRWT